MNAMQGLEHLHHSEVRYHGRLRSSNCLVDGRWVVKLSDWGLDVLHETVHDNEEDAYRGQLLYFAGYAPVSMY